jgi:predicted SAM-dependent methyltransferase
MKKSKRFLIKSTGLSEESFEIIRFELNMAVLRLRNKFDPVKAAQIRKIKRTTKDKLNLGAGPFGKPSYVNVDMFPMPNVDLTLDIRRKLPFNDETFLFIRIEHCFEHLDPIYDAPKVLNECYRILKPGGIVRIIVPDIAIFVEAYVKKDWRFLGNYTHDDAANHLTHVFRQGGEHKFGYDFSALKQILSLHNFHSILQTSFGVSRNPEFTDDLPNHQQYSLYVEAMK